MSTMADAYENGMQIHIVCLNCTLNLWTRLSHDEERLKELSRWYKTGHEQYRIGHHVELLAHYYA